MPNFNIENVLSGKMKDEFSNLSEETQQAFEIQLGNLVGLDELDSVDLVNVFGRGIDSKISFKDGMETLLVNIDDGEVSIVKTQADLGDVNFKANLSGPDLNISLLKGEAEYVSIREDGMTTKIEAAAAGPVLKNKVTNEEFDVEGAIVGGKLKATYYQTPLVSESGNTAIQIGDSITINAGLGAKLNLDVKNGFEGALPSIPVGGGFSKELVSNVENYNNEFPESLIQEKRDEFQNYRDFIANNTNPRGGNEQLPDFREWKKTQIDSEDVWNLSENENSEMILPKVLPATGADVEVSDVAVQNIAAELETNMNMLFSNLEKFTSTIEGI